MEKRSSGWSRSATNSTDRSRSTGPKAPRCSRSAIRRYFFTRFATSSSLAKSMTFRVNLISSAETASGDGAPRWPARRRHY